MGGGELWKYASKRRLAATALMILLGFLLILADHTGLSVIAVSTGSGKHYSVDSYRLCGFRQGTLYLGYTINKWPIIRPLRPGTGLTYGVEYNLSIPGTLVRCKFVDEGRLLRVLIEHGFHTDYFGNNSYAEWTVAYINTSTWKPDIMFSHFEGLYMQGGTTYDGIAGFCKYRVCYGFYEQIHYGQSGGDSPSSTALLVRALAIPKDLAVAVYFKPQRNSLHIAVKAYRLLERAHAFTDEVVFENVYMKGPYSAAAWLIGDNILVVKLESRSVSVLGADGGRHRNIYVSVDLDGGDIAYVGFKPPKSVASTAYDPFKELIIKVVSSVAGLRNTSRYTFDIAEIDSRDSAMLVAVKIYDESRRWLLVTWVALVDGSGDVEYWRYLYGYAEEIAVDRERGLVAFHLIRAGFEESLEIYKYSFRIPLPSTLYLAASKIAAIVNPSLAGVALTATGLWLSLSQALCRIRWKKLLGEYADRMSC